MKKEVSAGGIVVRKIGKEWDVLMFRDMNNNWTFPKGLVEQEEDPVLAAKREIFEEVGISDVSFVAKLTPIHYMYQRGGLISKTVHYFLFFSPGKETPKGQKEEGISDVQWIPFRNAVDMVGYAKTNRPLLEEAYAYAAGKSA